MGRSYPSVRESGYYTGFVGKIGIEYYTFKGNAAEKFDCWWGHDGWTHFLQKIRIPQHSTLSPRQKRHDYAHHMTRPWATFWTMFLMTNPSAYRLSDVPGSQTTSMYEDYEDWRKMTRPANENPQLQEQILRYALS